MVIQYMHALPILTLGHNRKVNLVIRMCADNCIISTELNRLSTGHYNVINQHQIIFATLTNLKELMLDGFLFSSSVETQQLGFRRIEHDFSDFNGLLNSLNFCKARECVFCLLS